MVLISMAPAPPLASCGLRLGLAPYCRGPWPVRTTDYPCTLHSNLEMHKDDRENETGHQFSIACLSTRTPTTSSLHAARITCKQKPKPKPSQTKSKLCRVCRTLSQLSHTRHMSREYESTRA